MRCAAIGGLVGCLLLLGSQAPGHAQGEFKDLVRYVPSSANALVLIDTQKIMKTGVAKSEDWKAKLEQAYAAGLTIMPADANQGVFASNMDFSLMSPMWETTILELDHDPNTAAFATRTGGKVEKIEKLTTISLPGSAYAVDFGKRIVGAMAPASRQVAGRWLREVTGRSGPALSPYLTEAFKYANDLGTPIIMAIDLDNISTPSEIRALLNTNDKYKSLPADKLDQLSEFVAGIRGLTLGVTFGDKPSDKPFGKVKVDFDTKVPFTPAEAKEAVLHALTKRGAMLTELNDWKPAVNGNQITLEGDFTSSGLRRLFSLVSPAPTFKQPPAMTPPQPTNGETPEQSKIRLATKTYFTNINTYLGDLNSQKNDAPSMGAVAMWYNKYADKLDRLPTLNVDPEMQQFGAFAADSMRAAGSALQNAGMAIPAKENQIAPVYDTYTYTNVYGYVNNGYYGGYSGPVGNTNTYSVENRQETERLKRAMRYEERGGAYKYANDSMQQLNTKMAEVRRDMTAKYKTNF